ncbi:MAG: BrnT family toxin [Hahellaceae bacterium]|nr:BrnT family toxin [Hahellaceae bacterium]MCP5209930.1 BrnT family toxin [Hahellaceae bacterium]
MGQIGGQHYLVVVHTFCNANEDVMTIRLISARPATKHEIRQYEQG